MDVKTLSVPETGRAYFDLGRNASYEEYGVLSPSGLVKLRGPLWPPFACAALVRMPQPCSTGVSVLCHARAIFFDALLRDISHLTER